MFLIFLMLFAVLGHALQRVVLRADAIAMVSSGQQLKGACAHPKHDTLHQLPAFSVALGHDEYA
jgi:hypothetical protein